MYQFTSDTVKLNIDTLCINVYKSEKVDIVYLLSDIKTLIFFHDMITTNTILKKI